MMPEGMPPCDSVLSPKASSQPGSMHGAVRSGLVEWWMVSTGITAGAFRSTYERMELKSYCQTTEPLPLILYDVFENSRLSIYCHQTSAKKLADRLDGSITTAEDNGHIPSQISPFPFDQSTEIFIEQTHGQTDNGAWLDKHLHAF